MKLLLGPQQMIAERLPQLLYTLQRPCIDSCYDKYFFIIQLFTQSH